jgi:alkyl hydroperoxide reductase subunit AhpF
MAKLLNDKITRQVQEAFSGLKESVEVLLFSQEKGCETCQDTRQLVEEVVGLSDKLSMAEFDLEKDTAIASQYKVDKAPVMVIAGRDDDRIIDFGIRMAGIPAGHDFSVLIQDLILVSSRDSGLSPMTRQFLKILDKPVHLQVFVTPT